MQYLQICEKNSKVPGRIHVLACKQVHYHGRQHTHRPLDQRRQQSSSADGHSSQHTTSSDMSLFIPLSSPFEQSLSVVDALLQLASFICVLLTLLLRVVASDSIGAQNLPDFDRTWLRSQSKKLVPLKLVRRECACLGTGEHKCDCPCHSLFRERGDLDSYLVLPAASAAVETMGVLHDLARSRKVIR